MSQSIEVECFSKGSSSKKQVAIRRSPLQATARDGITLRGYLYKTPDEDNENRPAGLPLLCLSSETGNVREYHDFALSILKGGKQNRRIYMVDMRGRGRSDHADAASYHPIVEAEDVISFCDAMGLHHIDLLSTGGSAIVALLVAPRRPSLVHSMVFNDGGPERDGVGIARTKAIYHQMPEPRDWEDAAAILKQVKGKSFPKLTEKQWQNMAHIIWRDDDGAPVRDNDAAFSGIETHVDFDQKQATLWPELAMFAKKPVMVLRGENSLLLTEELTARMKKTVPGLVEVVAQGQGHAPMIATHHLPRYINKFLEANDPKKS